jgi:hypothetical protein
MTDYFETDRIKIPRGHELFDAAMAAVEAKEQHYHRLAEKRAAKYAKPVEPPQEAKAAESPEEKTGALEIERLAQDLAAQTGKPIEVMRAGLLVMLAAMSKDEKAREYGIKRGTAILDAYYAANPVQV